MALEPAISTSTIKTGDGAVNMWARMGVLVSGGSITEATRQDAGTVASKINSRARAGFVPSKESLEPKIQEAITQRHAGGYNELVVERPTYAGLYISFDDISANVIQFDMAPHEEMKKASDKLGLKVYGMRDGVLFQVSWNMTTKQFELGNQVDTQAVRREHFQMSELQRHDLTEQIFKESPFRIHNPDVEYFDSRGSGKECL